MHRADYLPWVAAAARFVSDEPLLAGSTAWTDRIDWICDQRAALGSISIAL